MKGASLEQKILKGTVSFFKGRLQDPVEKPAELCPCSVCSWWMTGQHRFCVASHHCHFMLMTLQPWQKVAIVAYLLGRVSTRGHNVCAEILAPVNGGALLGALALPRLRCPTEQQLEVNCDFQHRGCARKPGSVWGSHHAKHCNKCRVRASRPPAQR